MKPKFDASVNATCLCFRRLNYPSWLCTQPALSDAVAPNGSQRAVTTVGDTAASKAAMANDDDRSSTSAESDDEAAAAAAAATAQQIWPFFEPVVFLETTHDNDEFAYDAATVFEPDATIRCVECFNKSSQTKEKLNGSRIVNKYLEKKTNKRDKSACTLEKL